jgi:hypothetical protein
MPITQRATLVSNPATTWFSTLSRADAVAGAITGIPSATRGIVTDIGRFVVQWPDIAYYPQDPGGINPSYVWNDATFTAPETVFFAHAFQFPTLTVALTRLSVADVFSDNINTLFLEEYVTASDPLAPVVNLLLGNSVITPAGGASSGPSSATPPFDWQTIHKFSTSYVPALPVVLPPLLITGYFFVASFSVTSYSLPPFSTNPAALQYIVELYDDLP